MTLLLTSAGRRVELLNCCRRSAREAGLPLRIIAADAQPEWSAACQFADSSVRLPRCDSSEYIPAIVELCRSENVALLVPTIDPELQPIADAAPRLAATGATVCISNESIVRICRDKLETARFLSGAGISVPRTAPLEEFLATSETWKYPVLLKPASGSASAGLLEVKSAASLRREELSALNGYIAQEKRSGAEYTVNLFFDRTRVCCAVPHRRMAVRSGEVSKGRTERVPVLQEIARRLGALWGGKAFGPLCFQAMVDPSGAPAVFEINARFGGGYPLAHQAGATFTRWLLELASNRPCGANDDWKDNLVMLRYDSSVFL